MDDQNPKFVDQRPYCPERLGRDWVLIGYMDEWNHGRLMDVPEDRLETALRQGWSIVFRWRDNPTGQHEIDPSQSNPNRTGDDEEC